jgi:hypothetical protein
VSELNGSKQSVGGPTRWALQFTLALVLLACGGEAATTTVTASAPTTSALIVTTTTAPVATTQSVDVDAVFIEALGATSANYAFQSVVSVGDTEVTTIQGVVDGESVAADISAGSSSVSYIRTPEGEWVTGPDEEWSVLEGEAPAGAPLVGLSDATDLVLESVDGASQVVLATLGPAAGPAAGARVSIAIIDGLIAEITYQAPWGADTASVVTSVSNVGAAGGVTAPAV